MRFEHSDFRAPKSLHTEDFLLRPIRASDARLDYDAVMESRESLLLWEQTGWPEVGFSEEDNRQDLSKLELRHSNNEAFCYTVMNREEAQCLGCVYIFPIDADMFGRSHITSETGANWSDSSAAIYFWVRQSQLSMGLDSKLLDALIRWMKAAWKLPNSLFVTSAGFSQQVEMIETAGLKRKFLISDPKASGIFVAYSEK